MTPDMLYQTCQWPDPDTRCMNEGWLFCTLCRKYLCEDHACEHLTPQVNRDAIRETSDVDTQSELENESKAFFRELSEQQLLDKAEIELRSYFRRLLQEAKRVQREIERRMIYATELSGGPSYRRQVQLSGDAKDALSAKAKAKQELSPEAFAERLEREERAREREQKKQASIKANIALLAEQVKLGNISIEQLRKLGAKR